MWFRQGASRPREPNCKCLQAIGGKPRWVGFSSKVSGPLINSIFVVSMHHRVVHLMSIVSMHHRVVHLMSIVSMHDSVVLLVD